jgi:hypothetical protein
VPSGDESGVVAAGSGMVSSFRGWAGPHRNRPPPGQDPRPGSVDQIPDSQPGRGITSVMGTSDRDDRSGALELLR